MQEFKNEKQVFYAVDEKILVGVLNYLSSKPFSEVAQLVSAIQSSKKIENKKEEKLKNE